MTTIEVDDRLYLLALRFLDGKTALGVFEGFHNYLELARIEDRSSRHACIDALHAAMGHDDGGYAELERAGDDVASLRRVVWSYQRAWVDCFGYVGSISESRAR